LLAQITADGVDAASVSGVEVTEMVFTAVVVALGQPTIPAVTVYDVVVVGLKEAPLLTPPLHV
jgi:hypothetical protein